MWSANDSAEVGTLLGTFLDDFCCLDACRIWGNRKVSFWWGVLAGNHTLGRPTSAGVEAQHFSMGDVYLLVCSVEVLLDLVSTCFN